MEKVPNHSFIEMRLVKFTATGVGKNETLTMKNVGNGYFSVTTGRTGVRVGRNKAVTKYLPIGEWDSFFEQKLQFGYQVTKTEEMEKKELRKEGEYKAITDEDVRDIVNILLNAANQVMEEEYSVSMDDISDDMLILGQQILIELSEKGTNISVAEFNNKLLKLWTAIPRPAKKLSQMKVSSKEEYKDKLVKEQELLDFLLSALRGKGTLKNTDGTILEANGLLWEKVTAEEENMLRDKMGSERARYIRAWKVTNKETEKKFEGYIKSHESCQKEDGISHLFHGSGTENFWSIITNGLYLNPQGVVISGKAFGHGLYFAPRAKKSIGYTSSYSAYWKTGNSDKAYLAVFKVATGNIFDIYAAGGRGYGDCPDNYDDLQKYQKDADCLWAVNRNKNSNSPLVNDEVIVYREEQATIEYLIEFAS